MIFKILNKISKEKENKQENKKRQKIPFSAPLIAVSILANQGSINTPN